MRGFHRGSTDLYYTTEQIGLIAVAISGPPDKYVLEGNHRDLIRLESVVGVIICLGINGRKWVKVGDDGDWGERWPRASGGKEGEK